jgi:hypothetical protein
MTLSGIFDNKKPEISKRTRDTWTGKIYESRNQAYQALAGAEGMDATNRGWCYYCSDSRGNHTFGILQ